MGVPVYRGFDYAEYVKFEEIPEPARNKFKTALAMSDVGFRDTDTAYAASWRQWAALEGL
jgi:hypothetical protein